MTSDFKSVGRRVGRVVGALVVMAIFGGLGATRVQATDYTWTGAVDRYWSTAGNWSPSGGPPSESGDVARIGPNGYSDVVVDVSTSAGDIIVSQGYLDIYADFDVDGDITVNGSGTLKIAGEVTVDGDIDINSSTAGLDMQGNYTLTANTLRMHNDGSINGGTVYADITFEGSTNVGLWGNTELVGTVDIEGDLWSMATITGDVTIGLAGAMENSGGWVTSDTVINRGIWEIDDHTTVDLGLLNNPEGTVYIYDGATVDLESLHNSNEVYIYAGATVDLGAVNNGGTIYIESGADVTWDSWTGYAAVSF